VLRGGIEGEGGKGGGGDYQTPIQFFIKFSIGSKFKSYKLQDVFRKF